MIPLDYLILRTTRRLLPNALADMLMTVRVGMKPGYETRNPAGAAERYVHDLERAGHSIKGAALFVLGYGGHYGLAVELLKRGAALVHLNDPYARDKRRLNERLIRAHPEFFRVLDERASKKSAVVRLDRRDVRDSALERAGQFDLVISTSVLEHVVDPPSLIAALAALTRKPNGLNLHYIDLRDHYFRRPFEMLCHSEATWSRFLNPPTNLNRWRLPQYLSAFEAEFGQVSYRILASDPHAFERTKARILPKHLTGNERVDTATFISVLAGSP